MSKAVPNIGDATKAKIHHSTSTWMHCVGPYKGPFECIRKGFRHGGHLEEAKEDMKVMEDNLLNVCGRQCTNEFDTRAEQFCNAGLFLKAVF